MRLEEESEDLSSLLELNWPQRFLIRPTGSPSLRTTPRPVPFWQLAQPGIHTGVSLSVVWYLARINCGFFLGIYQHLQTRSKSKSPLSLSPQLLWAHLVQKSWERSNRTVLGWGAGSKPQAVGQALPCNHFLSDHIHQVSGLVNFLRSDCESLNSFWLLRAVFSHFQRYGTFSP